MEKTKEEKKKKWLSTLIQVIIGMVIGALGSIYAVNKLAGKWGAFGPILLVLFMYIGIFIHINIHEFGHYIFGKIFGYRLISYRIGFFTWNYENGKMKFSIMKNNGYGGLCAMIPPQKELETYMEILFYAGGIILNILSGVLFISFTYIFSGLSETTNLFFYVLGIVGLFSGIVNLASFFSGNNPTDGKIIWSKIFKKPFADKMMVISKIGSQLVAGIRPRDLTIDLSIDLDEPQIYDLFAILYKYYKALDSNKLEDMNDNIKIMEEKIEAFPSYLLPALYNEFCYFACISGNKDKAKIYYEKAGKILERDKDVNGHRIKAYYQYYINKDLKAAADHCDSALVVADKYPGRGQAFMEEDLVKALKEKIENQQS